MTNRTRANCGFTSVTTPGSCRGSALPTYGRCFAHLDPEQRNAYLRTLSPGSAIDCRGVTFSPGLVSELLAPLRDSAGQVIVGDAFFEDAQFPEGILLQNSIFTGKAWFDRAKFHADANFQFTKFEGSARFRQAKFSGAAKFDQASFSQEAILDKVEFASRASFTDAQFVKNARFDKAKFSSTVWFERVESLQQIRFWRAQFMGVALFDEAKFRGEVRFDEVQFHNDADFEQVSADGPASFNSTQFGGKAEFDQARFSDSVFFSGAQFPRITEFGVITCARTMDLSGAIFPLPVTLHIATRELVCTRTRWESTATLQIRCARVDLTGAVLSAPLNVTAYPVPFVDRRGQTVDEALLSGQAPAVHVTSVRGVDAAQLVLTDINLSSCQFTGAFHLDQIRLEGRTTFAKVPKGIRWRFFHVWPTHRSQRRTVAEEHYWRAQDTGQSPNPDGNSPRLWSTGPAHGDPDRTPDPDDVAAVYRQLRKAFEDGKNEPGAADFYYGEMEMRRHDRDSTSRSERGLLHGYWLLSGYGLRASRSLGWLAAAMLMTILLLMGFGLPQHSPKQEATGVVPANGGRVTFTIDTDDPQNPTGSWFTSKRFEKALNVTLNSVVFRSSGQDLTTAGTYIEMGSRLFEPALLALTLLAIRGRIKR